MNYFKLFQNHSVPMMTINLETGVIETFNKSATNLYHLEKKQVNHFHDFFSYPDSKNISLTDLLNSSDDFITCTHKENDELRIVKIYFSPLDVKRKKIVYSIIQDITREENLKNELKQLNENLAERVKKEILKVQEKQELLIQKSKMESLGVLASGIAHEINQPLGAISMAVDNLYMRHQRNILESDYFLEKYLLLKQSVKRIDNIIRHIRTFSRSKDFFKMEEIDVNSLILETISLISKQYRNHLIDLQLKLDENISFTIGSKQNLEQVLINLLSNAKHAVDDKKMLPDFAEYQKKILLKSFLDNDTINIEVYDNGVGIPEHDLSKIFDPFFTTKGVDKGTGIGLSISLSIIKEMGGTLKFSSKEMEFTLAKISIPHYKKKIDEKRFTW